VAHRNASEIRVTKAEGCLRILVTSQSLRSLHSFPSILTEGSSATASDPLTWLQHVERPALSLSDRHCEPPRSRQGSISMRHFGGLDN